MLVALFSRPLRLMLVLATVLCAASLAVGSGATFTSASASTGNAFVSGTLLQTNTRTGAAILSAAGLRPGADPVVSDVTIHNGGTLPAAFRLAETNATNAFTAGSLRLRVVDVASSAIVYEGEVGGLGTKTLASFAPGESRTYRFSASLSPGTPTVDQGKSASADYTWNAVAADPAV